MYCPDKCAEQPNCSELKEKCQDCPDCCCQADADQRKADGIKEGPEKI